MRSLSLTILILLGVTLLSGGGCASVNKLLHFGNDDTEENSDNTDDPVAAAAMRLRKPASNPGESANSFEDRSWSPRYAPPAETISVGMGMDEVAAVWGEPTHVDTAGDPRSGNQRWTYYSGLSSRYGLGTKRVVYFEAGHVAGWKN